LKTRRIMLLGRSSLVISLPKQWLEYHKLKKGDAVSLSMRKDGSLVIYPTVRKEETKHVNLVVDNNESYDSLIRKMVACYLNGYESIEIKSTSVFPPHQQDDIRNIARMLYLRIMESSSKHIYLESLLDESRVSINASIRRMHSISYSMCKDAIKALKENNLEIARSVYALDDDVDHFAFFILRVLRNAIQDFSLAEKLNMKPLDCLDYQTLVNKIEHTADCASDIAKTQIFLGKIDKKIPTDMTNLLINMANTAVKLYNNAVKAFFAEDIDVANSIIDNYSEIGKISVKITESMLDEKDSHVVSAVCSLQRYMERIGEYATDIAEIVIDRSLTS